MSDRYYEIDDHLKYEYINGVRDFINHTLTLDIFKKNKLVRHSCSAMCLKFLIHIQLFYLHRNGFKSIYFI